MTSARKLSIFVHRASECLTDHESHGDGLICFSLLNGLAARGHQVYAYANTAPIRQGHPNLHVRTARHRVPANSLAPWEHSWRADRWLKQLAATQPIDFVWRMHPYGAGCPCPPRTGGRPLVVGPLFYGWPETPGLRAAAGRPRLGVGLQGVVGPAAERGWQRTLRQAALIFCATDPHTEAVQAQYPEARVQTLPVIVTPPPSLDAALRHGPARGGPVTLLFVANLVPNKNPTLFVELIARLRQDGLDAHGVLVGEGPERGRIEAVRTRLGIECAVRLLGKQANMDVFHWVGAADFLVSLSYGEPYGRGIAEAMSVGTPVLAHRSGGPADFIADGRDGLLADALTADAYAARLLAALSAPDLWPQLSAAALRKAQEWREDAVLTSLEEALRQTCSQARVVAGQKL